MNWLLLQCVKGIPHYEKMDTVQDFSERQFGKLNTGESCALFGHDLVADGDHLLIMGQCGEDGIIGRDIARRWKHIKVDVFGSNLDCSSMAKEWESDELNNGWIYTTTGPKREHVERKYGSLHITLCGRSHGTPNLESLDYDSFDLVLKVKGMDGGFGPVVVGGKKCK